MSFQKSHISWLVLPLSDQVCSRKPNPMLPHLFLSSFEAHTFPVLSLLINGLNPSTFQTQRKNNCKSYKVILQCARYLCLDNKQALLEESDKYRKCSSWLISHFFFLFFVTWIWDDRPCRMNSLPRFYGQKGRNPVCDNHRDFSLVTVSACMSPTCRKKCPQITLQPSSRQVPKATFELHCEFRSRATWHFPSDVQRDMS